MLKKYIKPLILLTLIVFSACSKEGHSNQIIEGTFQITEQLEDDKIAFNALSSDSPLIEAKENADNYVFDSNIILPTPKQTTEIEWVNIVDGNMDYSFKVPQGIIDNQYDMIWSYQVWSYQDKYNYDVIVGKNEVLGDTVRIGIKRSTAFSASISRMEEVTVFHFNDGYIGVILDTPRAVSDDIGCRQWFYRNWVIYFHYDSELLEKYEKIITEIVKTFTAIIEPDFLDYDITNPNMPQFISVSSLIDTFGVSAHELVGCKA